MTIRVPEQLIAAIHVISEGEAVLAPSVTRRVVEAFSQFPARQDHLTVALAKLTAREDQRAQRPGQARPA